MIIMQCSCGCVNFRNTGIGSLPVWECENCERVYTDNIDDPVNQPNHYTYGEIETIDYIRDKLTPEQFEGYCIGNVLKYISRYRHKGGKVDLEKGKNYLGLAIEAMEG